MGFSPLANMNRRIPHGNRQSYRASKISGFTIHHHAGVNAMGEATNPNREVSANYWISNEGDIIPQIDEGMRAWTTGAVGYPGGAESDHRNITVEVSNSPEGVRTGTWAISNAAWKALTNLIGDVFRRHNLGAVHRGLYSGVAIHKDFVATSCPGPYIVGHLNTIIAEAEKYRKGGAVTPAPQPVDPGKTISQLAQEVLAGKYGNGQDRVNALGSKYPAVQAEVNRILGLSSAPTPIPAPKPVPETINQLALEVLAGKYGNGAERQRRLGSNYVAVQAEVNRLLGLKAEPSPQPDIGVLAQAVIRGEYGNGAERERRLGSLYPAVQAEVNRRLGFV